MMFIVLFTYLFVLHSTLGTSTTYYLLAFKICFVYPVLKIKPRALYKLDVLPPGYIPSPISGFCKPIILQVFCYFISILQMGEAAQITCSNLFSL